MFAMHYILPFIIYWLSKAKDKTMLYGLLLGNLIDLDHIYYRIIGKVGWFESACQEGFGSQCSFGFYPLSNPTTLIVLTIISLISFNYLKRNKFAKWTFWISVGGLLNFLLDYIHLITGFGI